jgi:transposase
VLSVADGGQQGFFDAAWCGDAVPRDSFYGLLAEHGHRVVRDEDFAECYSPGHGRPSIPPSILAKILLLAYRDGVSDERAMQQVRMHLGWKVALGLPLDHTGYHPTTLVRFRARLLLHGKERLALERSVALAGELGLMDGSAEQIMDSTPMLGAAATQDTVRLVRFGVRRVIDAVRATDDEAAGALERGLEFDYARPAEKPDCDWRKKGVREGMLTRVAQDAERCLRAVTAEPGLAEGPVVAEAVGLLRELIGQDFDIDDDGVPRLRRGVAPDRIISVIDPEMRHGRKSQAVRFDGFKLHAAATAGPTPIITAIHVGSARDHDGRTAPALVDAQPAATRPTRVLGDSAYADQTTREDMQDRRIEVLAHVPTPAPRSQTLPKSDFAIDLVAGTVTCPAGHTATIPDRPQASGERIVSFRKDTCGACPIMGSCAPSARGRQIRVNRREDLLIAGRQALQDPEAREYLRRTRPRIERLLGLLVNAYHARKSRYRGTRKAGLQASFAAVLVNLNPIAATLRAETA